MATEPNATLQQVVQRCFEDPPFFESLIRDASPTLDRAGLVLSEGDRATLDRMLHDVTPADVTHIAGIVAGFNELSDSEWRPGWPMGWVAPDGRGRRLR